MNKAMDQFDSWAKTKELDTSKDFNSERVWVYNDIETQMFWECWLASRLALVGLLPGRDRLGL